jgi:purine-nucleoside phosphorylase
MNGLVMSENAEQAVALLRQRGVKDPVDIAVLLGFGLGGFSEPLGEAVSVDYADLPGFPQLREPAGAGRLSIGRLEGVNLCFLHGQAHFYDTGDPACMADALATIKALGAKHLLIFASAGSTKPDLYPGNLMAVTDHIALFGLNPLIGMVDGDSSFCSLNEAYDPRLNRRLKRAAAAGGVTLQDGVFMWVSGPTFSTPTEARIARQLGADVVGFGVAPEIILARRLGLRAAAVIATSHFSAGMQASDPSLAEAQRQAIAASLPLRRLLRAYVKTVDAM